MAWSLVAATMAFAVTACGSDDNSSTSSGTASGASTSAAAPAQPGKGKPPVTIGTKDFTEEFILGELYKGALEAKGYTVNLKKNIGATEIIDTALTSHKIDGYPEYTGVAVAVVEKRDEPAKSADETYQLAKKFYESRGQTVSEPTPFQDVDAIATTKREQLGGDQFMAVINSVNKLLTTDAITAMNKAVAIDKQDEATVAKQFLQANKLT
jgi:osmoprotectant transport system substrate-binding protein